MNDYSLRPIGVVESPVTEPNAAPRQGDEGAPDCWVVLDPDVREALDGLRPGDDIVVITWLHLADREVLQVHPRGDPNRPIRGVFATRSQHRPNPLGQAEMLAEMELPANATGAPMTYMAAGKQFIVFPVGGGALVEELIAVGL